jgi:signal transduction histidine kinase
VDQWRRTCVLGILTAAKRITHEVLWHKLAQIGQQTFDRATASLSRDIQSVGYVICAQGCLVSSHNASRYDVPLNGIELVASLAHEINSPIAALRDIIFLTERECTPKGRGYLELAQQELRRLSQITHTAMDEARATLISENTDICTLLRKVVRFYQSRLDAHSVEIRTRYSSSEKLRVHRGSVRQMFSNLLLNAADSMPHGGKIYVRSRKAREWGGMKRQGLSITIADNGPGIPAENLPKITEAFFTTKGSAGTGLGLSLVKNTVKEHDGVLRIRSSTKPGRTGSVFTIFLPRT